MYQSAQRPAVATASFSLLKFSKATDPESATRFTWVHYMNNDIYVFFDNYGSSASNSAIMKVIQGAQVLELVDLVEKVECTNTVIENARRHRIELRRGQLPFSALYRRMNSVIALQYQAPDHMIRRMQLRFTSVKDFDAAIALLQNLGCPLTDMAAEANTSSRPSTAASRPPASASPLQNMNSNENLLQASTYRPSSSALQSRPHTAFDSSHISYPDVPRNDDRPSSSASNFFSAQDHLYRSFTSPFAASPNLTPFRPSSTLFPINENEKAINTDPAPQTAGYIGSMIAIPSYQAAVTRSDPVVPNTSLTPTTSKHVGDFLPPRTLSIERPPITTQSPAVVSHLVQFENDLAEMNLMIPPRREYSFGRKSSSSNSIANPPSREGPSSRPPTAVLQPLSSRPSSGIALASEPPHDSSRPTTGLPPLPQPTFAGNDAIVDQAYANALSANSQTATKQTARPSTSAGAMQKPVAASKRAPTKKAAARPSTAVPKISANLSSSSPAARKKVSLVKQTDSDTVMKDHTSQSGRNAQLQSSFYQAAEAFSDPSSVTIQGDDKERLAVYAALPYEERMLIIENMLISSVGDENFIKLCQDVSGCWQRIGLDT